MMLFGDDDDVLAPVKLGVTDLRIGDCREVLTTLPASSIDCCITSPPYFNLRDYKTPGQIGIETTPDAYITQLIAVFREVRRVLKNDGTLWLNLGDSYASSGGAAGGGYDGGILASKGREDEAGTRTRCRVGGHFGFKHKDLMLIPARVAIALQMDGWYVRSDIIWAKNNCMPESVTDRPTSAYEHVFLLSKQESYYYDADAIAEPITSDRVRGPALHRDIVSTNGNGGLARRPLGTTRNARNVWMINTKPFKEAHFATMPPDLVAPCVLAGTSTKGHCPGCGRRWRREGEVWHPSCGCDLTAVPDVVLDPFGGAGTTALVAQQLGRNALLIELNADYAAIAQQRVGQ